MKKVLISMLIMIMITGCSSPDYTETGDTDVSAEVIDSAQKVEEENDEVYVDIQEEVIIDNEILKVTAKSIDYENFMGPSIKVLVENLSEQDITVQIGVMAVNNIMMEPYFSVDVASGKKVNDTITMLTSDFENYGIEEIAKIELTINVINSDSWDRIFESELITLDTNVAESYNQDYFVDGTLMIEEKGIKIVSLGLVEDFMGPALMLYIENNTDEIITVQSEDISLNGFMVSEIFSSDILPGKVSYDTISFMSSDLEENDIETIEEMELKIVGIYSDSWNRFFESDIIKLGF